MTLHAAGSGNGKTGVLAITLGQVMFTAMGVQMLFSSMVMSPGIFAPVVAPELNIGTQWVGVVYAVTGICGMIFGTLSSAIFLRFGLVRTLQAGALCVGTGMLLGATGIPSLMLVSAALFGLAIGPASPACTYLVAKAAPIHKLGLLTSIQQTGAPLGFAVGGVVMPAIILAAGWRSTMLLMALAGLAAAVALQSLRKRIDTGIQTGAVMSLTDLIRPLRLVISIPRLRQFAIAGVALSILHQGQIAFLLIYLNVELKIPLVTAGLITAASQMAAIVGRVGWGWLSDRWRDAFLVLAVIAFVTMLLNLALAFYPLDWPVPLLAAIATLYGATAAGWQGLYFAAAARHAPPGNVVTAVSGVQFFMFAGGITGPLVFAAIVSVSGAYHIGYITLAALGLALGLRMLHARRTLDRH